MSSFIKVIYRALGALELEGTSCRFYKSKTYSIQSFMLFTQSVIVIISIITSVPSGEILVCTSDKVLTNTCYSLRFSETLSAQTGHAQNPFLVAQIAQDASE